ncbi:MFS transporter, partial [Streptomyces sp. NPDC127064]|uniref:MFS transporter n=1 Tax=Streptomyces sp. NPDC127064 TaxID=3347124 RepID=UPI00364CFB5F
MDADAGNARKGLGILRERGFRYYWTARALSLIGDYAFRTAFATYIISVSGSASTLATATAVLLVPSLVFYLVGGAVGDRTGSRRAVMVGADLARFVILLLIAGVTYWTSGVTLLVVLAVLIGVADGFFQPVSFAYMLEITPKEKLVAANSALSVGQQIGLIGGPLVGGFMVSMAGASATFAFDAATFLLSAVLLLLVRTSRQTGGERGSGTARPDLVAEDGAAGEPVTGVHRLRQVGADVAQAGRYVAGLRWLLVSLVVGACTNAVYAGVLDVSVPLIMAPGGTSEGRSLGMFYALQGIGALAGAVVLVRLTVRRTGPALFLMLALMALSLAATGVLGAGGALAMAFVYGIGLHFFNSLFPSLLQEQVPESLLSRVGSLAFLGFNGLMPLGALLMGPLVAALDARGAATAAGLAAAVASLAALLSGDVRSLTARGAKPDTDARPGPAAGGKVPRGRGGAHPPQRAQPTHKRRKITPP